MLNRHKLIFSKYTTTKVGTEILRTLREIYTDYLVKVVTYYKKHNIKTEYDKDLFISEVNKALIQIPDASREWVTESLHETAKYYFSELDLCNSILDLAYGTGIIGVICVPQNKFSVSKKETTTFIFSDINLALYTKVDLQNKSIQSIRLSDSTIMLGVYDVN